MEIQQILLLGIDLAHCVNFKSKEAIMPSTNRSSISLAFAHDIVRAWNLPNMKSQKDVFTYLGKSTDSSSMSFYRQQAEEMTGVQLLPHDNKCNYV